MSAWRTELSRSWQAGRLLAWRRIAVYNFKILVGSTWWLYALGLGLWVGILVLRVAMGWNDTPWQAHDVQNAVISLPLVPIAIYFGMTLVYEEVENKTIEAALVVDGGGLGVWLFKLATAGGCLGLAACALGLVARVLLVPFPLVPVLANALLPVAFYGALALMLSLLLRGEIACGMLTASVLGLNLLGWEALATSRVNPFFNPLLPPGSSATYVGPETWLALTVQNRAAVILATAAMLAYSLHRTRDRERLV